MPASIFGPVNQFFTKIPQLFCQFLVGTSNTCETLSQQHCSEDETRKSIITSKGTTVNQEPGIRDSGDFGDKMWLLWCTKGCHHRYTVARKTWSLWVGGLQDGRSSSQTAPHGPSQQVGDGMCQETGRLFLKDIPEKWRLWWCQSDIQYKCVGWYQETHLESQPPISCVEDSRISQSSQTLHPGPLQLLANQFQSFFRELNSLMERKYKQSKY